MSSRIGTLKALIFPGVLRIIRPPPDVFRFTETTSNDAAAGDWAAIATPRDKASAEHTSRRVMEWLQLRLEQAPDADMVPLGTIDSIDDEHFARNRRGHEFQPQLFRQRAEQRADSHWLEYLADQGIRVSDSGQRDRSEAQFEVIRARQPGPIDDRTIRSQRVLVPVKLCDQFGHRHALAAQPEEVVFNSTEMPRDVRLAQHRADNRRVA